MYNIYNEKEECGYSYRNWHRLFSNLRTLQSYHRHSTDKISIVCSYIIYD